MSLLSEYTLSLIENEKAVIDFSDTAPSEFERIMLLRFFRKYKREVFVDFEGEHIFFMVVPWQYWIEYLVSLGFRDTAKACCEIFYDLEIDGMPTLDESISRLRQGKPVTAFKKEKIIYKKDEQYEHLKQVEINKVVDKRNFFMIPAKSVSELAFERDLPKLLLKCEGAFVAYIKGEIVGFDDDEKFLIETVTFKRHEKPDLVKKIDKKKEDD